MTICAYIFMWLCMWGSQFHCFTAIPLAIPFDLLKLTSCDAIQDGIKMQSLSHYSSEYTFLYYYMTVVFSFNWLNWFIWHWVVYMVKPFKTTIFFYLYCICSAHLKVLFLIIINNYYLFSAILIMKECFKSNNDAPILFYYIVLLRKMYHTTNFVFL